MNFDYISFMSPSNSCAYDDCVGELMANSSMLPSTKQRILNVIDLGKPDSYYKAIRHVVRRTDLLSYSMINLITTINGKFSKI